MPSRTVQPHGRRRFDSGPRVRCALVAAWLGLGVLSACSSDVGECCAVLDPAFADRVPTSSTSRTGDPTSDIALDPKFDCASLTCVAWRGTEAFCTEPCFADEDCPEDFVCRSVLEASSGPDAEIQPGDRFCVRDGHLCSE